MLLGLHHFHIWPYTTLYMRVHEPLYKQLNNSILYVLCNKDFSHYFNHPDPSLYGNVILVIGIHLSIIHCGARF